VRDDAQQCEGTVINYRASEEETNDEGSPREEDTARARGGSRWSWEAVSVKKSLKKESSKQGEGAARLGCVVKENRGSL